MGKFTQILHAAAGLVLGLGLATNATAQVSENNSAVEQYRIQSNYGPEEAILSPAYPEDNKVEFSGGASMAPLSSLLSYYGFEGSLIYHINRRHAIEPLYFASNVGKISTFINDQVAAKIDATKRGALTIAVPEKMFAASYLFSPFHAKLHLSERSVAHFDMYLGLGAGSVQTSAYNLNQTKGAAQWNPAGVLTAGIRMLFHPRFGLRFEARDFVHGSDNLGVRSTLHTFQIGLAASVFFGSFPSF